MDDDDSKKEAEAIGEVLPCYWTAKQRERAITLTRLSPKQIDEIIAWSRALNGLSS